MHDRILACNPHDDIITEEFLEQITKSFPEDDAIDEVAKKHQESLNKEAFNDVASKLSKKREPSQAVQFLNRVSLENIAIILVLTRTKEQIKLDEFEFIY